MRGRASRQGPVQPIPPKADLPEKISRHGTNRLFERLWRWGRRATLACMLGPVTANPSKSNQGAHIVLTCVGSLGDLHPYLALGVELLQRGHRPVVATAESFRAHVLAAGLHFHPIRAVTTETASPELIHRVFRGRRGVEYIIRQLILPALRTAYADTLDAAKDADLLIGHPLTFATPLVAEKCGIPWMSTQLAPTGMLSAYDPPVLPGVAWVHRLQPSPAAYRLFFKLAERSMRRWFGGLSQLRTELDLPAGGNPLFACGHSPVGELALFSPLLGPPQPDWPPQTLPTGFLFFKQPAIPSPELVRFLTEGPPPVIFTLGSSAVMDAGDFFRESAFAARMLGVRALLLGARPPSEGSSANAKQEGGSPSILACSYASYAETFPAGAAIVHQGGVGTTAEALRAGRPMLVVPWGVDQPDNAARVVKLGVARTLHRKAYRAARVVQALRPLLERPSYLKRAAEVGAAINAEQGAANACEAVERVLRGATLAR